MSSAVRVWCLELFYDQVSGTDLHDPVQRFRSVLSPKWAVWSRPAGVFHRPHPHVALIAYVEERLDPVAEVASVCGLLAPQCADAVVFSGCGVSQRSMDREANWVPGVRGLAV